MLTTSEIRQRFLDFFAERGHAVVASSSLVPGNDKTLLFTNAGMVQFKDVFTGEESRDYVRATTSQRCVRAGGKHNDLDNVGYTARHHTFFEMLGNFSFGDYFKPKAIGHAWEFLTGTLGLPADKLWVTVFDEDDEAERIWIETVGVPKERVIRIGAKDNFWAMGDTGPCGPCSEIFYDHGPDVAGGPPGSPDEDGDRYIEIWNLVFMQFERSADGTMTPLPKPSIDTGMGLERIAAVLQHVHSNYEIDLFRNLIREAARVIGTDRLEDPSLKVVADHIRSCSFMIVDGVLPGNEGRGYVLRRIIRRAARHGHKLGATGAFFHRLVPALVAEMGAAYPELAASADRVGEELLREEERFAQTLASGLQILDEAVANLDGTVIPGDVVFRLYDTYGFPADLTADIARERGLTLDEAGFEAEMDAQRNRSRGASRFADVSEVPASEASTEFVGYADDVATATVVELYAGGGAVEALEAGDAGWVVLDRTPFYGESGGQVGDVGEIVGLGAAAPGARGSASAGEPAYGDGARFAVSDTRKRRGAFLHAGTVEAGTLRVGATVTASIDAARRGRIRQHHSATHLLHGALREVLGTHVEQRGSLVDDERLRFDFSHDGPVGADEMRRIERWIDREVRANHPCETIETGIDEAKAMGAMALFGEKYGDRVRVVKLGDESIELCGGTHVGATGELGAVRVVSEGGVAQGVRRIEAVGGEAALAEIQDGDALLADVAARLKAPRGEIVAKLEALQQRNRELAREVESLQARLSTSAGRELAGSAEDVGGGARLLLARVPDSDAKALRTLMDRLRGEVPDAAIVLAGDKGGKAALVATVAPSLHDRLRAGDLLSTVAAALGGRGGGKADMAQGGAPSLDALEAAFDAARADVAAKLGSATSGAAP